MFHAVVRRVGSVGGQLLMRRRVASGHRCGNVASGCCDESKYLSSYALGGVQPDAHPSAWIADNAAVIGNVILKEDASVWFGATVRGDNEPITIGSRTNIQDGSVLHSDEGVPLTIGDDGSLGGLFSSVLPVELRYAYHINMYVIELRALWLAVLPP